MQAQVGTELSNGSYKQQVQMLNDMDIANLLLFFLDRYIVGVVFAMVVFALNRTKFRIDTSLVLCLQWLCLR